MGKVYIGQNKLKLYVNTNTDLLTAYTVKLTGTTPDGVTITPQSMTVEDASTGLVSHEFSSSDLATAGTYIFWVKVTYYGDDHPTSWGEPFHLNVYEQGN